MKPFSKGIGTIKGEIGIPLGARDAATKGRKFEAQSISSFY